MIVSVLLSYKSNILLANKEKYNIMKVAYNMRVDERLESINVIMGKA